MRKMFIYTAIFRKFLGAFKYLIKWVYCINAGLDDRLNA